MIKLTKLVEQVIPSLGYELVEIEITPTKIIRIFIDKTGGVTVEDCEIVSNHLSNLFLVEEIDYNRLEISSPGLDRPLKKINDYKNSIGKLVKIKTREVVNNEKVFLGTIEKIEDLLITIKCNNNNVNIHFDNILKSRLVFEIKKKFLTKNN
jgi:ribosome maturation factor RimP